MNQKKYPMVNIGTASILTVFVILAMVTFAVLTYMSARKDSRYTEQAVEAATQYQNAVNQAYEKIAKIDADLLESYEAGNFEEMLKQDYTFSIPSSDTTELHVTLVPCLPSENNGILYQITSFQEVNTEHWENDSTLKLMELQ